MTFVINIIYERFPFIFITFTREIKLVLSYFVIILARLVIFWIWITIGSHRAILATRVEHAHAKHLMNQPVFEAFELYMMLRKWHFPTDRLDAREGT